jgi:hypothetical protein
MRERPKKSFGRTLGEIFVVIFIIGAMSAFVFLGIPGPHGPPGSDARNTMSQVRLVLEEYYADHGSYPPAYGYLDTIVLNELTPEERTGTLAPGQVDPEFNDRPSCVPDANGDCYTDRYFVSRHYMHFTNNFEIDDLYDRFALDDNDTDFDNYISRLEYVPDGGKDRSVTQYSTHVVDGGRPFVYVPVNMRQFKQVAREWIQNWKNDDNRSALGPRPNDSFARNSALEEMHFPPRQYDAYVLMSVGPDRNTRGLLYDVIGRTTALHADNYNPNYYYHVAAMASFFMATRDLNIVNTTDGYVGGDGLLDFEYSDRKGSGTTGQEANYYPVMDGPGVDAPLFHVGGNFSRAFEDGLVERN